MPGGYVGNIVASLKYQSILVNNIFAKKTFDIEMSKNGSSEISQGALFMRKEDLTLEV